MDLRTSRLLMRAPRAGDVDRLLGFHDDPQVRRVFGPTDRDEVTKWIATAQRDWRERGHGRVVLLDPTDDSFLGRSGLRYWPEFDEIEVGWSLTAAARGRGLATEAGRFWLDWGFRELDAPYFTANIDPDNARSIAVAQRLGMSAIREDSLEGEAVLVFGIDRGLHRSNPGARI